ncbi:MAG: hypothetical protein Q9182_002307 [Xanthomendoza sp. 2 TL-2023]
MNYYEVLDVAPDAKPEEILKQYLKFRAKPAANPRMIDHNLMESAYKAIGTTMNKEAYDVYLQSLQGARQAAEAPK